MTEITYVVSDVGACHSDMVRLHHSFSKLGIGELEDTGHGEHPACDVPNLRYGLKDEASAVIKIGRPCISDNYGNHSR